MCVCVCVCVCQNAVSSDICYSFPKVSFVTQNLPYCTNENSTFIGRPHSVTDTGIWLKCFEVKSSGGCRFNPDFRQITRNTYNSLTLILGHG